jgi:NAD(P)-dependent dehydrogenase (short-subunit alcohol dehydrogenase family)
VTASLEGATLVVAGAGSGLGREVAAVALREGARVMLAARSAATLIEVASAIDPAGEHTATCVTDLRDPEACSRLVQATVAAFGGLDAVVTCAVAGDDLVGGLDGADLAEWRSLMETNLYGAMNVVAAAIPAMTSGGSIVFIGSQAAFYPNVVQTGYAASKGALVSAARHLAAELGPRGIRVNTVAPGWMWGPSLERSLGAATGDAQATIAIVGKRLPLRTVAEDGDVAEAAAFLSSRRAKSITGQCLLVNAGEYPG